MLDRKRGQQCSCSIFLWQLAYHKHVA
jgi:hypothetical protein